MENIVLGYNILLNVLFHVHFEVNVKVGISFYNFKTIKNYKKGVTNSKKKRYCAISFKITTNSVLNDIIF
uniref:Uncharacterized protein n=1 Tax=Strongyloides venezuelensis TaxID=75913 RepID=A0A0K0FQ76_STRVS